METISISRYSVDVPKSDITFFRNISRRMGWNIKKQPKSSSHNDFNETTLRALEEVREGKTFKADSLADLMAQLND